MTEYKKIIKELDSEILKTLITTILMMQHGKGSVHKLIKNIVIKMCQKWSKKSVFSMGKSLTGNSETLYSFRIFDNRQEQIK